jgi:uncharacterized protein (TIGR03437 family)
VESHGLLGTVQPSPALSENPVVNAASLSAAITPGAFTTIFGTGLAATTRIWNSADFVNGKVPVELDGVSVTINGKQAFVYFISPTQLNVVAPADTTVGTVPVVVRNSAAPGVSATALLQTASPAFFAAGKYAVATHADGGLVGPASPAKEGETIVLFGTGFGSTTPPADGQVVNSPANLTTPPIVTIGSTTATVAFAGRTAPGLDQINVTIPPLPGNSTGTMDVSITAKTGVMVTQNGLLLTVQPGK